MTGYQIMLTDERRFLIMQALESELQVYSDLEQRARTERNTKAEAGHAKMKRKYEVLLQYFKEIELWS